MTREVQGDTIPHRDHAIDGPMRPRMFGLVILIAGIEYLFGWPDALSLEPRRGLGLP